MIDGSNPKLAYFSKFFLSTNPFSHLFDNSPGLPFIDP